MEIIKVKDHTYLYEPKTRFISLVPNYFVENSDQKSDYIRYNRKLQYFKDNGLITQDFEESKPIGYLKIGDIEIALHNTHQLVFEVTDKCNLNCYYCSYGTLYSNHDMRENKDMPFEYFTTVYNFFRKRWNSNWKKGFTTLYISFYGGEPLCNFHFIQKAVEYTKLHPINGKHIRFSMTTNGVLLNRYMEFLKENNFDILISIDGNSRNHSYRKFRSGSNSFNEVVGNIRLLKETYPKYFKSKVKFNSVLHDHNSIKEIDDYIFSNFGKHPTVSELNPFGIDENQYDNFLTIFKSKEKSFKELSQREQELYGQHSPQIRNFTKWIFLNLMTTYSTNISHIIKEESNSENIIERTELPTKTCIPFERKMYISVNGKIFPCERIGHKMNFGQILNGKLEINFEGIVKYYNSAFKKYHKLCGKCIKKDFCSVCITGDQQISNSCNDRELKELRELIEYFSCYPKNLMTIIKKVSIV
ncbi:MAG: radical SAM peptide maturase [Muribaculaceae bacterium]|nr:radical SAM peptide maturase [Muribaculaceae bacterium]